MTTEEKERQGTPGEVREFVPPAEYPIKLVAKMLGIDYKNFMNYTSRKKIASFKKGGRRYVTVEEFNRVKAAMADGTFPGKQGRKKKEVEKLGGSEVENPDRPERKQPTKIVDRSSQKKLIDKAIDFGEEIQKHKSKGPGYDHPKMMSCDEALNFDDSQPKKAIEFERPDREMLTDKTKPETIINGECLLGEKPSVINIKIGTVNVWPPKESESEKTGQQTVAEKLLDFTVRQVERDIPFKCAFNNVIKAAKKLKAIDPDLTIEEWE